MPLQYSVNTFAFSSIGEPAALFEKSHYDWIPTQKLGHDYLKPSDPARYERAQSRNRERMEVSVSEPIDLSNEVEMEIDEGVRFCSISTQTDMTLEDIEGYINQHDKLQEEVENLKKIVTENAPLDKKEFEDNDGKVKFYTGLPNLYILMSLFEFITPYISHTHLNSLTSFQEFILTLMRLRLNLGLQDLGYRFGIAKNSASRIFIKWITVMACRLEYLIQWPSREMIWETTPECFRKNYGTKVVVILDCFEVFMDRPSNLLARACTWSNYKHHNTAKFLIGITPQGTVSFISKGWGGRTSDRLLTEQSGILKNLLPGDIVLADRGFTIEDIIALYGARLDIPAFTKGKEQLDAISVEETRRLANVRIHVERVIGVVRQKYQILSGILPIETVTSSETTEPLIDDIVKVCCALTNMCDSVVPVD